MSAVKVTRWHGAQPATEAAIQRLIRAEGLSAYAWQNGPHDTYASHRHSYDKVIYVVRGSITFGLPELGESVSLAAGDRLDLPRGVRHDAQVGPEGVVCLEAHLP
ncbi:MAG: cupin [Chloroflexota bacterium]|nr:cupin [Chloroflexota bacterium]MDQ5864152.1 cupin [Chloroflexota bacterium]